MVNQQYKEGGGCCGTVLFSIESGCHPYKISSMTFHMRCPPPSTKGDFGAD
jgi:hypothetical protein